VEKAGQRLVLWEVLVALPDLTVPSTCCPRILVRWGPFNGPSALYVFPHTLPPW
jgi:hypothetical protein